MQRKTIRWRKYAIQGLEGAILWIAQQSGETKANKFPIDLNIKLSSIATGIITHAPCKNAFLREFGLRCFNFQNYVIGYSIEENDIFIEIIYHFRSGNKKIKSLIK
jgi:hypothetical protein